MIVTTPHAERDPLYFHSAPTPVPIFQREWEWQQALALYAERKPMRICEVGSYHGGTLYHWLRCAAPGAVVVSIDSYAAGVDNRVHYADWTPPGVALHVLAGDSRDAAIIKRTRALGPFDWIFIDAGHLESEVTADWENYGPLCAPGGVVLFHDICETHVDWIQVSRLWRKIRALGYLD